jgi:hypothetical protein
METTLVPEACSWGACAWFYTGFVAVGMFVGWHNFVAVGMFVGLHRSFVVAVAPALFKAHGQRSPIFFPPRGQVPRNLLCVLQHGIRP